MPQRPQLVVVSNPQSPSGLTLDREGLLDTAERHPASTLVVEESTVDFLPDPAAATLAGADVDNVIVLRSAAEFYETGAARTGVAWSRDRRLLRELFGYREVRPVSGLDLIVAEAALAPTEWAAGARRQLAADGAWLHAILQPLGGRLVGDSRLPYRCLVSDRAPAWAASLAGQGMRVRAVTPEHGVHPGAIGVSRRRLRGRSGRGGRSACRAWRPRRGPADLPRHVAQGGDGTQRPPPAPPGPAGSGRPRSPSGTGPGGWAGPGPRRRPAPAGRARPPPPRPPDRREPGR
ncbi:MAG TPA: hypothetical protein VL337_03550 [Acidimicrobiales bacterium]|nr:hypothetical protein [Acidimicrobiales bacterium]